MLPAEAWDSTRAIGAGDTFPVERTVYSVNGRQVSAGDCGALGLRKQGRNVLLHQAVRPGLLGAVGGYSRRMRLRVRSGLVCTLLPAVLSAASR
jgi:hypothetical protein